MPDIDQSNPPGLHPFEAAINQPDQERKNIGTATVQYAEQTALGTKHSTDKPPLHLINRAALVAEAEVLAFGARKYAPWNWSKGLEWADAARAAIGHLYAFLDREDLDPESRLSHVAHARAETGFLLEFIAKGTGVDDRRPGAVRVVREDDSGTEGSGAE